MTACGTIHPPVISNNGHYAVLWHTRTWISNKRIHFCFINGCQQLTTGICSILQWISTDTLVVSCRQKLHVVLIPFDFSGKSSSCCRYVTLIIMLELISILQFILTSFQFLSSDTLAAFRGRKLVSFWCRLVFGINVVHAYVTSPCIILLELMSILQFILTSFLYQNSFLAKPLLFSSGDNPFRSDAVWFLAQMLFMLTLRCPA